MTFAAKLTSFEGPLDLLLHLIDKNKVDIYDIPISMITDQYMEYVEGFKEADPDPDVMSEFLVMAATLLDIKAKMLLPAEVDEEGNEEDPRAELVEKLLEYKLYKYMSVELKDKHVSASKTLYKTMTLPDEVAQYEAPIDLDRFLDGVTASRLKAVFDDVMERSRDKVNPAAVEYGKIKREEVNVGEKTTQIRAAFKREGRISFRKLIESKPTKINIIVTFLAVLELMKNGEIVATQEDNNAELILHLPENNDGKEQD